MSQFNPSNVDQFLASIGAANQGIQTGAGNLTAQAQMATQRAVASGANQTALAQQQIQSQTAQNIAGGEQATQLQLGQIQAQSWAQKNAQDLMLGREEIQSRQGMQTEHLQAQREQALRDRRDMLMLEKMKQDAKLKAREKLGAGGEGTAQDDKDLEDMTRRIEDKESELTATNLALQEASGQFDGRMGEFADKVKQLDASRVQVANDTRQSALGAMNRTYDEAVTTGNKTIGEWIGAMSEQEAAHAQEQGGIAEALATGFRHTVVPVAATLRGIGMGIADYFGSTPALKDDPRTALIPKETIDATAFLHRAAPIIQDYLMAGTSVKDKEGLGLTINSMFNALAAASVAFKDGRFSPAEKDIVDKVTQELNSSTSMLSTAQLKGLRDALHDFGAQRDDPAQMAHIRKPEREARAQMRSQIDHMSQVMDYIARQDSAAPALRGIVGEGDLQKPISKFILAKVFAADSPEQAVETMKRLGLQDKDLLNAVSTMAQGREGIKDPFELQKAKNRMEQEIGGAKTKAERAIRSQHRRVSRSEIEAGTAEAGSLSKGFEQMLSSQP